MAVCEDIFSEGYLDEFYKTHVASRRTTIDDAIAAIEAEITKVQQYRRKFRSYRVEDNHLNSCGNSECSDDDDICESKVDMEMLPTSVFKVFNSTSSVMKTSSDLSPSNGNIFNWSQYQIVSHDHNYSSSKEEANSTIYLIQDSLNLEHVQWAQLSASKRQQALRRLSTILRNKPKSSHPLSPYSPSLTLLPHSLADLLRSNNGVVVGGKSLKAVAPSNDINKKVTINSDEMTNLSLKLSTPVNNSNTNSNMRERRKARPSPYDKRFKAIEVTRIRNSSSTCSENETPLEVD